MTKCPVIPGLVIKPQSRLSSDARITTHIATQGRWRDGNNGLFNWSLLDKSLRLKILSCAVKTSWWREARTPHTCCQAGPLLQMSALCVCWGQHLYQSGPGCGWSASPLIASLLSAHKNRIPTGKVKVGSPAVKYIIRPPDKYRMR